MAYPASDAALAREPDCERIGQRKHRTPEHGRERHQRDQRGLAGEHRHQCEGDGGTGSDDHKKAPGAANPVGQDAGNRVGGEAHPHGQADNEADGLGRQSGTGKENREKRQVEARPCE
jgi:hypothetical protein